MKRYFLFLLLAVLCASQLQAQNLSACPGLKNPASFTSGSQSGSIIGYWTGQTGTKISESPNSMTGATGVQMTSAIIPASQLNNQTSSTSSNCQGGVLESTKRFRIMSYNEGPGSGSQLGKDPNTGYGLPYVPSGFTKSIRVGNCHISKEAEALYYNMEVSTENALLFIHYAIVIEAPGHGTNSDPAFVIRVSRPSPSTSTTNFQQISDTLCYSVSSTPANQGGSVTIGQNGWHQQGSGYNAVYWREWNQVAINLNKYLYERVRIEVFIGDCNASGHYGYCYVAGDCRPMEINATGCPAGEGTVVSTLTAPGGLISYQWYHSNVDGSTIASTNNVPDSIQFTAINDSRFAHADTLYCDTGFFRVDFPDGTHGLTNNQVFRCDMTSAMDPAKPYISKLYARVINNKPTVMIDTLKDCDRNLKLVNLSYVPHNVSGCDTTLTKWWFYAGSTDRTPLLDSMETNSRVTYQFDSLGAHAVKVRAYSRNTATMQPDLTCFTDKTYRINVLGSPKAGMYVSTHDLCDSDMVTLMDTTPSAVRRDWIFVYDTVIDSLIDGVIVPTTVTMRDTVLGDRDGHGPQRTYVRGFAQFKNPVGLRSYNGLYHRDSINTYDTVWCTDTFYDTISVFKHPEMTVSGDSVVCRGEQTDIYISTDIDSCTYKWYRNYLGTQSFAEGPRLQVAPYADTSRYYVKVISPKQCEAWDSVNAFMVVPTLAISKHDMCYGDNVTLTSGAADHYSWRANPPDSTLDALLDSLGHGPSVITVRPDTTTVYTLIGHGSNGCSATPLTETITIHPLPIPTVSTSPRFIDSDDPVVTFSDVSPYSVSANWFFPGSSNPIPGSPVTYDFGEVSDSAVNVTLVAYNDLGCSDTLEFAMPVTLFTFYAPNIFTPDRSDNNKFSFYTLNEMENFHVYIYDRTGRLVFQSEDLHFAWDGTHMSNGTPCPQGTYVYISTYRRPSTEDIVTQKGTFTLIR